jgi:hypothetical protein
VSKFDIPVRSPEVTLTGISGSNYCVHDVVINVAVNSMPSATVRGTRANVDGSAMDSSKTPLSLDYLAKLASDDQNDMWRNEPPTLTLTVDDGQDNQAKMEGWCAAPAINVGVGRVLEQRTIVHKDHCVSGINFGIYENKFEWASVSKMPICDPNKDEAVFAVHVFKLMEYVLSKSEHALKNEEDNPDAAEYIKDTDDQNQKLFSQWLVPILGNSQDTALKLGSVKPGPGPKCQDGQYGRTLLEYLFSSTNILNTFQNSWLPNFLMQQVTNWDAKPKATEFMHSQTFAGPGSGYYQEETVDVMNVNFSMGGQVGEMPLGQINVMARKRVPWAGETAGVKDQYQSISSGIIPNAGWPKNKKPSNGEVRQIMAPSWMTVDYRYDSKSEDMPSTKGSPKNARNAPAVVQESTQSVKEQMEIRTKGAKNFLHCWAKKHYVQQSLQNCTASMTIPLDISWGCQASGGTLGGGGKSVGWVFKMSASNADGDDIFLFEGYLVAVTHDIHVGERTGKATTRLDFTHVKGPNWTDSKHEPKYGCAPWVEPEL